jgi:flagellar biosynthetic protein FlhB
VSDQKTEQPTQRRQQKAREEGQFLSARQLVSALQFLTIAALTGVFGPEWISRLQNVMRAVLAAAFSDDFNVGRLWKLLVQLMVETTLPLFLAGGLLMVATAAAQLASTKMGFSLKRLAPSFNRLNPVSRLKEMAGENVASLIQAAVMLPIFSYLVYALVRDNIDAYVQLPFQDLRTSAGMVGDSLQQLLWKAAGGFVLLGVLDLARQQRKYAKSMRMTKQEIREEHKESEGDPHVKSRLRRIRRDLLRRRMMQEVPNATAVIVNPTHYAIAIKFDMNSMAAPLVVAKGKNYLALRIRRLALEHQVPLIENPPLAQALYKTVDVGQEIPAEFYKAVAEILGYIYRLMNGRASG